MLNKDKRIAKYRTLYQYTMIIIIIKRNLDSNVVANSLYVGEANDLDELDAALLWRVL